MNDGGAWQNQFAQGFSSSGGGGNIGLIVGFFVVIGLVVGVWYLVQRYGNAKKRFQKRGPGMAEGSDAPIRAKYVPAVGRLNPLQQKRIQELINEFRHHEGSAQAVPSSVLEKYSEFFFYELHRMKTTEKEVEDFINQNYPLEEGFDIELDFPTAGTLHLIKSKVLEITGKHIVVEYRPPIPEFLKKGTALQLNYNVGKNFLQGSTVITDVRNDVGLFLRKPEEVVLTAGRRYSRIGLDNASGSIADPRTTFNETVKVLDLSLEGVRVQVGRPLKKGQIYQLIFGERGATRNWAFGPIEVVPSQAFMTSSGTNEAGLLFLYLDIATKSRLIAYMKQKVQEAQEGPKVEAESPTP